MRLHDMRKKPISKRTETQETGVLSWLRAWIEAIEIGPAVWLEHVAVVPLFSRSRARSTPPGPDDRIAGHVPARYRRARALGTSIAKRRVEVRELRTPRVDRLELHNSGSRWVLGLAGEIVLGGKQDRALASAVLLAPRRQREVAVNCIERHRWSQDEGFRGHGGLTEASLRATAQTGQTLFPGAQETQETMWREISSRSRDLQLRHGTESYQDILDAQERRVDALLPFVPLREGQRGVLILGGERVIACDIFADEALLKAYYRSIVASILPEVAKDHPYPGCPSHKTASHLLTTLAGARWDPPKEDLTESSEAREAGPREDDEGGSRSHGERLSTQVRGVLAQVLQIAGEPIYLSAHPYRDKSRDPYRGHRPPHTEERDAAGALDLYAPEGHERLFLFPGCYVIGRSSRCDIRLLDPHVSRRHAELTVREDGTLTVRDLESSLGTFLDEDEEIVFAELAAGSMIRLGAETRLRWRPDAV